MEGLGDRVAKALLPPPSPGTVREQPPRDTLRLPPELSTSHPESNALSEAAAAPSQNKHQSFRGSIGRGLESWLFQFDRNL